MKFLMTNRSLVVVFYVYFITVMSKGLKEGSLCDVDGLPGVCRNWRKCLTFAVDLQNFTYPPICSFEESEPIICCNSCVETDKDISNMVMDQWGLTHWKTDQISWNKCIDYYTTLPYELNDVKFEGYFGIASKWVMEKLCYVVYATQTSEVEEVAIDDLRREYPHMALLGYGMSVTSLRYLCGGAIISDRYVLSAAHCIYTPKDGPVTFVALGMHRSDDYYPGQVHMVLTATAHPEYDPKHRYHDIALVRTITSIKWTPRVLPACLPTASLPLRDEESIATGWDLPNGIHNYTVKVVRLQKFNDSTCSQHFPPSSNLPRGFDPATQLCYEHCHQPNQPCKGENGPLQIQGQIDSAVHTIIGVATVLDKCGSDLPELYTNVAAYASWKDTIVWNIH